MRWRVCPQHRFCGPEPHRRARASSRAGTTQTGAGRAMMRRCTTSWAAAGGARSRGGGLRTSSSRASSRRRSSCASRRPSRCPAPGCRAAARTWPTRPTTRRRTAGSNPLPLRGTRTLAGWSALLDEQDLFPAVPTVQHAARDYRRWAYESAFLDLALRQAGATLGRVARQAVLAGALRCLVEPSTPARWLELYPAVELKVDAGADWVDRGVRAAGGLGRPCASSTSRGSTGRTTRPGRARRGRARPGWPPPPCPARSSRIRRATTPEVLPEIERIADRPSPSTHRCTPVDDLAALPPIRHLNVKPSRFGTLERLCACLDHCRREGIADARGRPVRARRRPGPDPGAREPVLSRRAERLARPAATTLRIPPPACR